MEHVRFVPWVGKNYGRKDNLFNGTRIMILGESHYGAEPSKQAPSPEDKDFTHKVVRHYVDDSLWDDGGKIGYKGTFTRIANICSKEDVYTQEEKAEFFQSVIFYNYVQSYIPDKHNRPTEEQFKDSCEAFIEVLHTFLPDGILVLGKETWRYTPDFGGKEIKDFEYSWIYTLGDNHKALMAAIYHPAYIKAQYGTEDFDSRERFQRLLSEIELHKIM
jgi:hypothetical protein